MKKIVLYVLAGVILIQFIRPEKNDSSIETNALIVPAEISVLLEKSCNDCHSNKTEYPWYSEIAPVSWYLAFHVNDGKEHLNLSEWNAYNKDQKKHIIHDIQEVLEEKEMPLKSYLILHDEAKLGNEEYELLVNWAKTLTVE